MSSIKPQNLFLGLSLLTFAIIAVSCSSEVLPIEPPVETQPTTKQVMETQPCRTDPVFSLGPNDPKSKNMEAAWRDFVESGQYRLACSSDGDFTLDAAEPKTIESYSLAKQSRSVSNWGNWSYPKRISEDHLAVIVVDTRRTDANRFGLAVFSPPRNKKDAYDLNWLYQERDLTRASVGMSSGSVWVENYIPDGKRSLCWLMWNRSKEIFECRDTSR